MSSSRNSFSLRLTTWAEDAAALAEIRHRVFIEEQSVPEALEWDGLDAAARHVLAQDADGYPIGCGRLLPEGKIGRMAVLPPWRRHGVGTALLHTLLQAARADGLTAVMLSAQLQAIPFYERAGFQVCSAPYQDAGIPHCDMRRTLTG